MKRGTMVRCNGRPWSDKPLEDYPAAFSYMCIIHHMRNGELLLQPVNPVTRIELPLAKLWVESKWLEDCT